MTDTRLVLLDGIPGSGKSTTAQRLYLHLLRHDCDPDWFYEFDETHPILSAAERRQVMQSPTTEPGVIREQLLDRWGAFAAAQMDRSGVTILDGSFLQVPLGILLLMNDDSERVVQHVLDAGAAVAPLNPLLVYLYQEDVAAAILAICEQRRTASFAEGLIKIIAQTPYGKSNEVRTIGDIIKFYEETRVITSSIFQQLEISVLEIETSAGDWVQYEREITQALALPEMGPLAEPEDPEPYVGCYRSDGDSEDMILTLGPKGLCLDGYIQKRLIPKDEQTFLLEATCVELRFEVDGRGRVLRFHLEGPLEFPESVWTKVAFAASNGQDQGPPTIPERHLDDQEQE